MTFQKGDFPHRLKWQIGRDYPVQSGQGKPTILICKHCKHVYPTKGEYYEWYERNTKKKKDYDSLKCPDCSSCNCFEPQK